MWCMWFYVKCGRKYIAECIAYTSILYIQKMCVLCILCVASMPQERFMNASEATQLTLIGGNDNMADVVLRDYIHIPHITYLFSSREVITSIKLTDLPAA